MLYANLIVGKPGVSIAAAGVPDELAGGSPLWIAKLSDKREVILVGRIMPMDQQNRDQINYLRRELVPKATLSKGTGEDVYVEIRRVVWDPVGGNILLVAPMGPEAVRTPEAPAQNVERRTVTVSNPGGIIEIPAPNGAVVGTLILSKAYKGISLQKNIESEDSLGKATLTLNPRNLIPGEKFQTTPQLFSVVPSIDRAEPRKWEYKVVSSFDGSTLTVELRQLSVALRNANLSAPMSCLSDTEELVMRAPIDSLRLSASAKAPETAADVRLGLLLRNT